MTQPDVQAVNRNEDIVLLDDDTIIPITDYFDVGGRPCAPEDAVTCVAGQIDRGWWSINLRDFTPIARH